MTALVVTTTGNFPTGTPDGVLNLTLDVCPHGQWRVGVPQVQGDQDYAK